MADRDNGHSSSSTGVLEKVAKAGSVLRGSPMQTWQTAREGTQALASVLPEADGLGSVKHFIRRHPVASACAALAVGYAFLGTALPMVGGVGRLIRGR
jgi:hypothetical protein